MEQRHTCYMECGSIINGLTGNIIENPAVFVDASADVLHGWGEMENVEAKFKKFAYAYSQAGMANELNDLMLIELSQYKITREAACYILRRATEFTATGFIRNLCENLTKDPVTWLESEMKRIPINIEEKEW